MNDEQYHGCYLGFIGDENLPSYVGIISYTIRIAFNQPV